MMDVVEQLQDDELFVDAVDDAITEIRKLRKMVSEFRVAQDVLETTRNWFHQRMVFAYATIVSREVDYNSLRDAIGVIVNIGR